MFSPRTMRGPSTARFHTPVCTVRPRQVTSCGSPTLTATSVAVPRLLRPSPSTPEVAARPGSRNAFEAPAGITQREGASVENAWSSRKSRCLRRCQGLGQARPQGSVRLSGDRRTRSHLARGADTSELTSTFRVRYGRAARRGVAAGRVETCRPPARVPDDSFRPREPLRGGPLRPGAHRCPLHYECPGRRAAVLRREAWRLP